MHIPISVTFSLSALNGSCRVCVCVHTPHVPALYRMQRNVVSNEWIWMCIWALLHEWYCTYATVVVVVIWGAINHYQYIVHVHAYAFVEWNSQPNWLSFPSPLCYYLRSFIWSAFLISPHSYWDCLFFVTGNSSWHLKKDDHNCLETLCETTFFFSSQSRHFHIL